MAKKKDIDVKIKIAIITGIFLVIAYGISAYLGSPLVDTQWKERPIVEVSFGDLGISHPKEKLQDDEDVYFVDIMTRNRGVSDGKIFVTITGNNATVNFDKNNNFESTTSLRYTISSLSKNYTTVFPPIYVIPNANTETFSIEMIVTEDSFKPLNQELNVYKPTVLTYKKLNEMYELIDER